MIASTIVQAASSGVAPPAADASAWTIVEAITAARPRTRYTVGRGVGLVIKLTRLLSDRALDRLLAANLKPHWPKASPA